MREKMQRYIIGIFIFLYSISFANFKNEAGKIVNSLPDYKVELKTSIRAMKYIKKIEREKLVKYLANSDLSGFLEPGIKYLKKHKNDYFIRYLTCLIIDLTGKQKRSYYNYQLTQKKDFLFKSKEIMENLDFLIKKYPNTSSFYFLKAISYHFFNKKISVGSMLSLIKKSLKLDSKNHMALTYLGYVFNKIKKSKNDAKVINWQLSLYNYALELRSDYFNAMNNAAYNFILLKDFDRAQKIIKRMIRLFPFNSFGYKALLRCYQEQNTASIKGLIQTLASKNPILYWGFGKALISTDSYRLAALNYFLKAFDQVKNDYVKLLIAKEYLDVCKEIRDKKNYSIMYQKVIHLKNKYGPDIAYFGAIYLILNAKISEAEKAFISLKNKKMLLMNKAKIDSIIAMLNIMQGNVYKGNLFLKKAYKADPYAPDILFNYGLYYFFVKKDKKHSKKYWKIVLEKFPNSIEANKIKKILSQ